MVPSADPMLYLAALTAAYLLPGPDMAMVMTTTMRAGIQRGFQACAGLAAARAGHVLLSGLGLSAVFATYPVVFDAVRWLGAAYLIWLAWAVARAPRSPGETPSAPAAGPSAIRQGFLTNLLNPKAFMFCALLLPQFITATAGSVLAQYLVLGAVLVVVGFLFDGAYVLAANGIGRRLGGNAAGAALQRGFFATVFVLLAIRLATGDAAR